MTLHATATHRVTLALGLSQTISWASSYYLPAILAAPMAAEHGLPLVWVFAAFSQAMTVSAVIAPAAGARLDAIGGRGLLMVSNLIFAAGLGVLAVSTGTATLFLGWALMGVGMGTGLYEAAFAMLARIYGAQARGAMTGITLIAGFASTVGWPLSGLMVTHWGWREACVGWALIHLCVALPLNAILPSAQPVRPDIATETVVEAPAPPKGAMALLAFVFAGTWFISTAMAAHLPSLLQAAGASSAAALVAGALIGPAGGCGPPLGRSRAFDPWRSCGLWLRPVARGGQWHPDHRQGDAALGLVRTCGLWRAAGLAERPRTHPASGGPPWSLARRFRLGVLAPCG